jgi:hypothetical protein
MSEPSDFQRKADVLQVLRRLGVSEETIQAVDAEFDDPINVDELANFLLPYGITHDSVVSWLGGSP